MAQKSWVRRGRLGGELLCVIGGIWLTGQVDWLGWGELRSNGLGVWNSRD